MACMTHGRGRWRDGVHCTPLTGASPLSWPGSWTAPAGCSPCQGCRTSGPWQPRSSTARSRWWPPAGAGRLRARKPRAAAALLAPGPGTCADRGAHIRCQSATGSQGAVLIMNSYRSAATSQLPPCLPPYLRSIGADHPAWQQDCKAEFPLQRRHKLKCNVDCYHITA